MSGTDHPPAEEARAAAPAPETDLPASDPVTENAEDTPEASAREGVDERPPVAAESIAEAKEALQEVERNQ